VIIYGEKLTYILFDKFSFLSTLLLN